MFREVLKDYRSQFKDSLGKLSPNDFLFYFLLVIDTLLFSDNVSESHWWLWLCYFTYFLTVCLANILADMYPNEMSKTLMLCPLSEDQRRRYLHTGYWVRVCIPIMACLILEGVGFATLCFSCREAMSVLKSSGAFILYQFCLLGTGIPAININYRPVITGRGTKEYPQFRGFGFWHVAVILNTVLFGFFSFFLLNDGEKIGGWKLVVCLILLGVHIAVCLKIFITYRGKIMEQAVHYELQPQAQKGEKKR